MQTVTLRSQGWIVLSEQVKVEQAGLHDQSAIGRVVAAIRAKGVEGRPIDAAIIVGHADPVAWYPQVHHALGVGQVDVFRIPLEEIPGVRRGIGPHASPGRRRGDHHRPAEKFASDDGDGWTPENVVW